MNLKKSFLRNRINSFSVKKKRMTAGIILGVVCAVLFFNFLHLIRLFAIFSQTVIGSDFEPVFLKPEEAFIYNLLFGFISVFFSFSVIYNYWFERPNKVHEKHNYKRKFFLNQQRTTNWFFIHWFVDIAFMISFFVLFFSEINFYDEYKYYIFIFIAAFTSQIWSSIRPMIRTRKLQWLLVTFLMTFITSFIVSNTSLINPENLQKKMLKNNFIYEHDVQVVESSMYSKKNHSHLNSEIIIPDTVEDMLFFERNKMEYEDLASAIFRTRNNYSEYEVPYLKYIFFIDKRVNMNYLYEIKKQLQSIDVKRIAFSVKKKGTRAPFYHKSIYVFGMNLSSNILEKDEEPLERINIVFLGNSKYLINEKEISKAAIYDEITQSFAKEGIQSMKFEMKANTSFKEYFQMLAISRKVINDLRDQYAKKTYQAIFDSLEKDVQSQIKEKYYWHVYESINR